jgi:hypothetical protein
MSLRSGIALRAEVKAEGSLPTSIAGRMGALCDSEGYVEIRPGVRVRAYGMLSRHPQCDAIRRVAKQVTGRDWPDVPVVMDMYCKRHQAIVTEFDG